AGGERARGLGADQEVAAPPPPAGDGHRPLVTELGAYWRADDAFGVFRSWRDAAEPCRSCAYHSLCRGGCRVVSSHAGDAASPDPECPRVVDHGSPRKVRLPVV
ncbi:MAG: SPASM domain-containing protein, partial [Deltaproteobacteria bacterium]|nr:SPASM domain-containing protein [Kofleriaceae bacterium]